MTELVTVIGAGGFGRETLDVISAINQNLGREEIRVVGVVDDAPSELALRRLSARGIPWTGTVEAWLDATDQSRFVIAVGDPRSRAALDRRLMSAGREPISLVHPRAGVGTLAQFGDGVVVCAGAEISTNVSLGRHVHVNPNSIIGHDCVLDEYVSVNPGAIISGEVAIHRESLIGAGAVILQGREIGERCTVGASACVTRSIGNDMTVKGVPAR